MELPVEKSKPKSDLKDYLILLYGRPKTGKTTLAAQFEDPLFLFFEPGGRSLSLYQQEITNWKDFKEVILTLKKEKRFKTVVIDTVDSAYEHCMVHVCKEMGISHPQDEGYGKAWAAVDREFSTTMSKLGMLKRGVILISHAKDKDVEKPDGTVKEMTGPSLANQGMKWADRNADLFAFYHYGSTGKRYIQVKGNDHIVAGNRIDGHFLEINKFYAGESAEECYKNFINAFNNIKQEDTNGKTRWIKEQDTKLNRLLPNRKSETTLEGSERRSIKIRTRG